MKKSWFVALVIFLTLLLVGVGSYFFFPSFKKIGGVIQPNNDPLFGTVDDNNPNNDPINPNSGADTTPGEFPDVDILPEESVGFRAFKLGDYAVSSLQPLDFKTGTSSTSTLLLSVGRGSGIVRLYDPQIGVTSIIGTISVPNIITSEFTANGTYVVVQSQDGDSLKTIVLKSDPRTPTEERFFSPIFSSSNVTSFFIDGNTIYFIEKIKSGAELYEYVPSSNKRTLLYRGLLGDIYGFAREGTIFIGTKAAENTLGFIFKLDKTRGLVTKLASGNALVGIPNQNGTSLLITEFFGQGAQTNILNVKTKETTPVSIKVLKEKCVPNFNVRTYIFCGVPNNLSQNMPDSWYMGKVSTNDTLYLIDSENGSTSILTSTDEDIDVIRPHSSRYSGILTFINKKNSHPWIVVVE